MHANINILDGIIRLFLACAIGILGAIFSFYDSPLAFIGILAVPLVVSSLSGWCSVYSFFKIYTTDENPYKSAH